jgi:cyclomaltodextrinase / maltogenic alpha-amylase / neopullulanase
MRHWVYNTIFYHIYPLGFCGAPFSNDFSSSPVSRLEEITSWLDHIQSLGANALYLGPVFESSSHGYDTADYHTIDRRLGTRETLTRLSTSLHERGIRLILDGVFNHVGRNFWAFRDVQARQESSPYRDWFSNLRFHQRSPYQDPFSYEGWNGHFNLVKLNLRNPQVKEHLFRAVEMWIQEFNIDGLRLDAADCLDSGFMQELAAFCRKIRPDFWLMGEVIHGDYRNWANTNLLDSVTNYESYKGLYSSHVDRNFFEIAYSLNRQFGPEGIYRELQLYSFADNHDVNRVATSLANPAYLYTLYPLLFTIPGIPSIYYGSEWGLEGKKENGNDLALRPRLELAEMVRHAPQPALPELLTRLAAVRQSSPALQYGNYRQLLVDHEQFAFSREADGERMVIAVNTSDSPAVLQLKLLTGSHGSLVDQLNYFDTFSIQGEACKVFLQPHQVRIMREAAD